MKLGLLLSGAVRALDIQSQFRAYIDTAYPSCQAVIAKCERPFIGYDVKERVFDFFLLRGVINLRLMSATRMLETVHVSDNFEILMTD